MYFIVQWSGEVNVFGHVCLSVCLSTGRGSPSPCTGSQSHPSSWTCSVLSRLDLCSDMFKLVHCVACTGGKAGVWHLTEMPSCYWCIHWIWRLIIFSDSAGSGNLTSPLCVPLRGTPSSGLPSGSRHSHPLSSPGISPIRHVDLNGSYSDLSIGPKRKSLYFFREFFIESVQHQLIDYLFNTSKTWQMQEVLIGRRKFNYSTMILLIASIIEIF